MQRLDGRELASADDLTRQVALVHGGDTIRLEILRDGQRMEIDVRSGVRPSEAQLASNDTRGGDDGSSSGSDAPRVLGMRVEHNPDGGLMIDGVRSDSDASEKGLRRGDIILKANGKPTANPQDLSAAVAEARRSGRKDILLMVSRSGSNSFIPVRVPAAKG